MKASTPEAHRLLAEGALALSEITGNGVRVDKAYLDAAIVKVDKMVAEAEAAMKADREVYPAWKKAYRERTNLGSRDQIAKVVFGVMGHAGGGRTKKGTRVKADKRALEAVDLPFVKNFLKAEKLKKAQSTYLIGLRRELVERDGDWFVHPLYSLNTASSFRSGCVAKGTIVETVRDLSKNPGGKRIEEVEVGDYVYCYDSSLNLTLRKVLWAGKTGRKAVIRLHWIAKDKYGHLDVTPDHKVRLSDGRYVAAEELFTKKDLRPKWASRKFGKVRCLAMARGRKKDRLFVTNRKDPVLDHRLVYENLVGHLPAEDVVHHKDGNHYNNAPENLERMTNSEHSRLHWPESLNEDVRRRGNEAICRMWAAGLLSAKKGEESSSWISLTKFGMLRLLSSFGGKVTKIAQSGTMDFDTFKRKADLLGVDLKEVKDRYDTKGKYVSRGRLKRACRKGVVVVKKRFGYNHYKAYRAAESRGIPIKLVGPRRSNSINNHRIVRVERLPGKVDVYDLTVEGEHNYIANEICVHNCAAPNFQNQPNRDKEVADMIRHCYIPRRGCDFAEPDYSQVEVRASCPYHEDPTLIKYVLDKNTDMHLDMACQLFKLEREQVDRKGPRDAAKNLFVFPEFYGQKWFDTLGHGEDEGKTVKGGTARGLWEAMESRKFVLKGTDVLVKDHLRKNGVKRLGNCDPKGDPERDSFARHVRDVEKDFWENRFKVYNQWKKDWFAAFLKNGGFMVKTGFWIGAFGAKGLMTKNDVTNYPIQSVAFHCLLWSLIRILKRVKKYKMKALVVGEIHDSFQADVPTRERTDFFDMCVKTMTKDLPRAWDWINVPLDVEVEVAPEGFSWFDKVEFTRSDSGWGPAEPVGYAAKFKRPFVG